MDQDLLSRLLGTAIRNALAPVFAILVAKGWIVEGDAAQLTIVIITQLAALLWGAYAKITNAAREKLALDMPAGSTPAQLKEVAKNQQ